jgi:hypothetical protein
MALENFTHDANGIEIHFEGNPNLKKPRTRLAYTKEHAEEFTRCASDVFYFAENYYKILDLKKGMITPKLRDYQFDMINSYLNNRFSIILATRQAGKCVCEDTIIKVRNKETLVIEELSISEFYSRFS